MIYQTTNSVFETFADALDAHYLTLNNNGYDLCELEGIHVIPLSGNKERITLLFSEDYGTSLSVDYTVGTNPVEAIVALFN